MAERHHPLAAHDLANDRKGLLPNRRRNSTDRSRSATQNCRSRWYGRCCPAFCRNSVFLRTTHCARYVSVRSCLDRRNPGNPCAATNASRGSACAPEYLLSHLPSCVSPVPQLKRERSLAVVFATPTRVITTSQRHSSHWARRDISEFESYPPSQAVRSLQCFISRYVRSADISAV